ncbi:hypothetical protein [Synechococcus sp. MIT S9508]|uniref:hypothetical protein n=1 Tax=Synechococcus sp. MIT S9508 TaxID=1801629 RepID=UPI0012E82692|nr:hypothetical protein [Synechococcus sp. MIT S9508]
MKMMDMPVMTWRRFKIFVVKSMKSSVILFTAMLLTGCSTTAVVCRQWRNKELSAEKEAKTLGISPAKTAVPHDQS